MSHNSTRLPTPTHTLQSSAAHHASMQQLMQTPNNSTTIMPQKTHSTISNKREYIDESLSYHSGKVPLNNNSPHIDASSSSIMKTPTDVSQIRDDIESFLLSLPLGSDAEAADVEHMVAERLLETEVARAMLQQKVQQWAHVASELHDMVSRQQVLLLQQQTDQQQQQKRASNASSPQYSTASGATPASVSASKSYPVKNLPEVREAIKNLVAWQQLHLQPPLNHNQCLPPDDDSSSTARLFMTPVHSHHNRQLQQQALAAAAPAASVGSSRELHHHLPYGGSSFSTAGETDKQRTTFPSPGDYVVMTASSRAWSSGGGAAAADGDGVVVVTAQPRQYSSSTTSTTSYMLSGNSLPAAAEPAPPQSGQAEQYAVALALAKDERDRLRRALLDAEMDLQKMSDQSKVAKEKVQHAEAESAVLKSQLLQLRAAASAGLVTQEGITTRNEAGGDHEVGLPASSGMEINSSSVIMSAGSVSQATLIKPQEVEIQKLRHQVAQQESLIEELKVQAEASLRSIDEALVGARKEGEMEAEAVHRRQALKVQREHDEHLSTVKQELVQLHAVLRQKTRDEEGLRKQLLECQNALKETQACQVQAEAQAHVLRSEAEGTVDKIRNLGVQVTDLSELKEQLERELKLLSQQHVERSCDIEVLQSENEFMRAQLESQNVQFSQLEVLRREAGDLLHGQHDQISRLEMIKKELEARVAHELQLRVELEERIKKELEAQVAHEVQLRVELEERLKKELEAQVAHEVQLRVELEERLQKEMSAALKLTEERVSAEVIQMQSQLHGNRLEDLIADMQKERASREKAESELEREKGLREELQSELSALHDQLGKYAGQVRELEATRLQLVEETARQLSGQLAASETQLSAECVQRALLMDEVSQLTAQNQVLEGHLLDAAGMKLELEEELMMLQNDRLAAQEQLHKEVALRVQAESRVQEVQQAEAGAQARLEEAKALLEDAKGSQERLQVQLLQQEAQDRVASAKLKLLQQQLSEQHRLREVAEAELEQQATLQLRLRTELESHQQQLESNSADIKEMCGENVRLNAQVLELKDGIQLQQAATSECMRNEAKALEEVLRWQAETESARAATLSLADVCEGLKKKLVEVEEAMMRQGCEFSEWQMESARKQLCAAERYQQEVQEVRTAASEVERKLRDQLHSCEERLHEAEEHILRLASEVEVQLQAVAREKLACDTLGMELQVWRAHAEGEAAEKLEGCLQELAAWRRMAEQAGSELHRAMQDSSAWERKAQVLAEQHEVARLHEESEESELEEVSHKLLEALAAAADAEGRVQAAEMQVQLLAAQLMELRDHVTALETQRLAAGSHNQKEADDESLAAGSQNQKEADDESLAAGSHNQKEEDDESLAAGSHNQKEADDESLAAGLVPVHTDAMIIELQGQLLELESQLSQATEKNVMYELQVQQSKEAEQQMKLQLSQATEKNVMYELQVQQSKEAEQQMKLQLSQATEKNVMYELKVQQSKEAEQQMKLQLRFAHGMLHDFEMKDQQSMEQVKELGEQLRRAREKLIELEAMLERSEEMHYLALTSQAEQLQEELEHAKLHALKAVQSLTESYVRVSDAERSVQEAASRALEAEKLAEKTDERAEKVKERALMAEERAELAEERAHKAEEAAGHAEERALKAEERAEKAEEALDDAEMMFAQYTLSQQKEHSAGFNKSAVAPGSSSPPQLWADKPPSAGSHALSSSSSSSLLIVPELQQLPDNGSRHADEEESSMITAMDAGCSDNSVVLPSSVDGGCTSLEAPMYDDNIQQAEVCGFEVASDDGMTLQRPLTDAEAVSSGVLRPADPSVNSSGLISGGRRNRALSSGIVTSSRRWSAAGSEHATPSRTMHSAAGNEHGTPSRRQSAAGNNSRGVVVIEKPIMSQSDLEALLDGMRSELRTAKADIQTHKAEVRASRSAAAAAKAEAGRLRDDVARERYDHAGSLEEYDLALGRLKQKMEAVDKEREVEVKKRLKMETIIAALNAELASLNKDHKDLQDQLVIKEHELSRLVSQLEERAALIEELSHASGNAAHQVHAAEQAVQKAGVRSDTLAAELDHVQHLYAESSERLRSAQRLTSTLSAEAEVVQRRLTASEEAARMAEETLRQQESECLVLRQRAELSEVEVQSCRAQLRSAGSGAVSALQELTKCQEQLLKCQEEQAKGMKQQSTLSERLRSAQAEAEAGKQALEEADERLRRERVVVAELREEAVRRAEGERDLLHRLREQERRLREAEGEVEDLRHEAERLRSEATLHLKEKQESSSAVDQVLELEMTVSKLRRELERSDKSSRILEQEIQNLQQQLSHREDELKVKIRGLDLLERQLEGCQQQGVERDRLIRSLEVKVAEAQGGDEAGRAARNQVRQLESQVTSLRHTVACREDQLRKLLGRPSTQSLPPIPSPAVSAATSASTKSMKHISRINCRCEDKCEDRDSRRCRLLPAAEDGPASCSSQEAASASSGHASVKYQAGTTASILKASGLLPDGMSSSISAALHDIPPVPLPTPTNYHYHSKWDPANPTHSSSRQHAAADAHHHDTSWENIDNALPQVAETAGSASAMSNTGASLTLGPAGSSSSRDDDYVLNVSCGHAEDDDDEGGDDDDTREKTPKLFITQQPTDHPHYTSSAEGLVATVRSTRHLQQQKDEAAPDADPSFIPSSSAANYGARGSSGNIVSHDTDDDMMYYSTTPSRSKKASRPAPGVLPAGHALKYPQQQQQQGISGIARTAAARESIQPAVTTHHKHSSPKQAGDATAATPSLTTNRGGGPATHIAPSSWASPASTASAKSRHRLQLLQSPLPPSAASPAAAAASMTGSAKRLQSVLVRREREMQKTSLRITALEERLLGLAVLPQSKGSRSKVDVGTNRNSSGGGGGGTEEEDQRLGLAVLRRSNHHNHQRLND
ncbi:hypothetical protein CEUSTIGMA_g8085.t1 [Chlamydomonas eustigma]|uniref:Uncharacterized protein n=1 Tax=Chlamydomonas eustigma TaxID=1157962 RepID=A0A250XD16_9CHLO|nr:hypothetical protein CEUSTIGMA_g8085.t1 [Chlamydomonas eustigma]|eukprot:GAX80650.1 hypothetical protein CEUSTIGMA_g8085.t1 [Chlamydomonas eustigma]